MDAASISTAQIRYIKLGPGGLWAKRAFLQSELHLGHKEVPHDVALNKNKIAIAEYLVTTGRSPGKANDFAREIVDFYALPENTIWFTLEEGCLWWVQATTEVLWLGPGEGHGARIRPTLYPWRNTDLKGRTLATENLSTKLTKVAAYRQTLCSIAAEQYLRSKLQGEDTPLITQALEAQRAAIVAASCLISTLHWADFETLVDLILTRGGWHRFSALGGNQKDADLLVEQAVTGETALVQVKSAATQSILNDYVARFDAIPSFDRLIFVCHSPHGSLTAPPREDVIIWEGDSLARAAVRNGLFDWLLARAG